MGILLALVVYGLMLAGCAYLAGPALAFLRTDAWRQTRGTFWLVIASGAVALLVFAMSEHTIAHWDRLGAWSCAQYFADDLLGNGIDKISDFLYKSIETQDYTSLSCLMTGAAMRFIGDEYGKMILAAYGLYVMPFLICMAMLVGRHVADANSKAMLRLGYLFCAFFPPILVALYNNPSDVSGLPIAGALAVAAAERRWRRFSLPVVLVTAVLLAMLFILKRYYIFYGAACLGGYGLAELIDVFSHAEQPLSKRLKALVGPVVSVLGVVGLLAGGLALGFPGFYKRSFFNDYASAYTGHRYGDWLVNLRLLGMHFSWLYCLVAIVGCWVGIKRYGSRFISVWAMATLVAAYLGLTQVQSFDWNHYLVLVAPILLLLLIGISLLEGKWKQATVGVTSVFMALNYGIVFVPAIQDSFLATAQPILMHPQLPPRSRPDVQKLKAVAAYLNKISYRGGKIYVLASSEDYNEETLTALARPDVLRPVPALYESYQHSSVDKQHGFPVALLQAAYVVVADPIQYHVGPDKQLLVGLPAEQILAGEGIGASYRLLKSFDMGTGVHLRVYKKTAPWPKDAKAEILGRLKDAYPTFPKMYTIPYQAERYADVDVPPGYAAVQTFDDDFAVYVHPPDTGFSRFSINLVELPNSSGSVVFTPTFKAGVEQCAPQCGEVRVLMQAGNKTLLDTICRHQDKPTPIVIPLPSGQTKVSVAVGKGNNTDCCDWFQMEHIELRPN